MDCYIVRIYRQTEHGEVAGMIERVGGHGKGRPFSSYSNLVATMRADHMTENSDDKDVSARPDTGLRVVHSGKT